MPFRDVTGAMHRLILASQSPRRRELLEKAGFMFTVASVQISEIPDENLNLPEQIRQLAQDKATALVSSGKIMKGQGFLILSSDTVVVLDGVVLGKPKDRAEAASFLSRLSGKRHQVITAVCLWDLDSGRIARAHDITHIDFRRLTRDEIQIYADSDEGLDKAGGYGIQGPAGAFVDHIEGSIDTVVGLPIALVERMLHENGWIVHRRPPG